MTPDPRDINSLKEFFSIYEGLSTSELAILANRCTKTIRIWKRKCGISPEKSHNKLASAPKFVPDQIYPPEVWDNPEWLEARIKEGYGNRKIAKMTGQPRNRIKYRLRKYGIKRKEIKPDNPCFSSEWMHFHYASRDEYLRWCEENDHEPDELGGMGLTTRECADLAGVDDVTIINWAVRLRMRIYKDDERYRNSARDRDLFFEAYRRGACRITDFDGRSVATKKNKSFTTNKTLEERPKPFGC